MGVIEVKYFNSFILRKTSTTGANGEPYWNGSRGDNTHPQAENEVNPLNWAVEESRIRGGYNNTSVSLGAKAYLVEDEPNAISRTSSLIYSGIFNSRTGVNNTNVFSIGDDITKSLNPAKGSIQKLHAENTNLTIFQESKVSRALIDKDAIYSAEGGGSITSSSLVIGAITPYSGNYGISRNPESFAIYGTRKYFTDKDRNVVLRLSNDGITEISNYGMSDFFRDQLSALDTTVSSTGKALGMWDIHNKQYVLSLQPSSGLYSTVAFDDSVNGFPSFFTYKPSGGVSVRNSFYTMNNGILYKQYSTAPNTRGVFYGVSSPSKIKFIFNPKVSMSKVFKTLNYEGGNGWQVDNFVSDTTGVASQGTPIDVLAYTEGNQDIVGSIDSSGNTLAPVVYSYNQGSYDDYGNESGPGVILIPPINHAGFNRKENKYMTNLTNNSIAAAGEVLFGANMTGIKGYFATVTMSTDSVTDVGGMKELFAASSNYVESSY